MATYHICLGGMGLLQLVMVIHFLLVIIFTSMSASYSSSSPVNVNPPLAKPGCIEHCGNVSIPFPFGTREGCYLNSSFLVTCNHTAYNPPKLFLLNSTINITSISLAGQLRVLSYIAKDCYYQDGSRYPYRDPFIKLSLCLTVNTTANKFTAIGCDTNAFLYGYRLNRKFFRTGCNSWCGAREDLVDGICSGTGCCQTNTIPEDIWNLNLGLRTFNQFKNVSSFNNCSYGFVAEEGAFNFSSTSLTTLRNVDKLPMVVDWAVGDTNCEQARNNMSNFACKSMNSTCHNSDNGYGYRCYCENGYQGNPYLDYGCQEIDECQNSTLNDCVEGSCVNTAGSYMCECPKGYYGDGKKLGKGCIRIVSESIIFKLVGGIASGVCVLLLAGCCLYLEFNRRKLIRMKEKFFLQNGGLMLQEQLNIRGKSPDMAKIFTSLVLNKATNNFHESRIIGQGGFGIVYKGFLYGRTVAIKKSKEVDPNQVEQFINEVIVLSQINHKNVVRLLGCCLETQAPLLVYEFINNGTLFEHIDDKTKARDLSWDKRLRIATEAAGVLAYLHSAASPPIIHRDIKSANILLDNSFTAKVSDFGASRLVPLDQTQLSTMVQGTFGYLDPEYLQTNQLTAKSDVYSFGVVLVELLTGKKALSYDQPEEERNLSSYFLSKIKQGHLFEILDDNIVREKNDEQIISVAMLAKRCLYVKGDERPCMKEVATELEGLTQSGRHVTWEQNEPNAQEMQNLLTMEMANLAYGEGSSINTDYNSSRDHISLPMGGGR